jgi:integrase
MPAISEKIVASLPTPASGNKLHYFSGATLQGKKAPSGFAIRVTAAGTKSFVLFYRKDSKSYLDTIGRWDENAKGGGLTVLRGIIAAKGRADEIQGGKADPRPARTRRVEDGNKPDGESIADMLDEFVQRYIEKDAKLRTGKVIKRAFERLVKPAIGQIGVYDLRRSGVVRMLDTIADDNGPVMADRTLAYLRKAFHWRAARDDDFSPPIVRGMSRTKPTERSRDRILADDEIRDLWKALDAVPRPSCYARYVRFLLHTATRRDEASHMRWDEIVGDVWTIPGARYKNKRDHAVPLTAATRKLIGEKPKDITKHPYVFSTTGGELAFGGKSWAKRILEKKIAELRKADGRAAMPPWTLHDLRRTARSLMSRAGVPSDHAERAIGHAIDGVRGVYDRHEYLSEKEKAFAALASLIGQILNPAPNVTQLTKRRQARV